MLLLGLFLGLLAGAISLTLLGTTLGFFLAGFAFATLLTPTLGLAERSLLMRIMLAGAVADGIALLWIAGVLTGDIAIVQWIECYAMLIAWVVALIGIAHLLQNLLRREILASATTVLLAFIWLTWPIWLREVDGTILIRAHPLLACNGVLSNLGIWTQRPLAYQHLFKLGQDIPYALPHSIGPMVAIHFSIGIAALLLGRVVGRR